MLFGMSNYVKVNTFGQKKGRKIKEKKKKKKQTTPPHQVFSIVFPTLKENFLKSAFLSCTLKQM